MLHAKELCVGYDPLTIEREAVTLFLFRFTFRLGHDQAPAYREKRIKRIYHFGDGHSIVLQYKNNNAIFAFVAHFGYNKGGDMAERAECPVSLQEFLKLAKTVMITVEIEGRPYTFTLNPKEFTSGSFGWFTSQNIAVTLAEIPIKLVFQTMLVLANSKNAPRKAKGRPLVEVLNELDDE